MSSTQGTGAGQHHDHDDHDDHDAGHEHSHAEHVAAPAGGGHHGHSHRPPSGGSTLFWALLFTVACLLIEGIGGLLAGSLALLADAAHMLTDAAALAMSYAAVRAAIKPATGRLSYGHHRWQVLAAFVNGLALLLLAVWILGEAARRLLLHPQVHGAVVAWTASRPISAPLRCYPGVDRV
jgi:cobalt-zinc-cadmium efflux system protein